MRIIISIIFIFEMYSCNLSYKGKEKNLPANIEMTSDIKPDFFSLLYAVDSVFNKFIPDTSLEFSSEDELRKYYLDNRKRFENFCNNLESKVDYNDSIKLAIRQAEIHHEEMTEVNNMKFFRSSKKNIRDMNLLGAFSPFSRIISMEERINLYHSFPEEVKKSNVGQKTWKKIMDYSFDKNIGKDIGVFNKQVLLQKNFKLTNLGKAINPYHSYTILIYGASWCGPCRLEELQLKKWMPLIDTTIVKVIGLSVDKEKTNWIKYLEKDKLPWDNFLLFGELSNEMVHQLSFESIPMNILINADGKIIAQNTDIRKILELIPELGNVI